MTELIPKELREKIIGKTPNLSKEDLEFYLKRALRDLDAKDAEIKRLHDLHYERTKLTSQVIGEKEELKKQIEQLNNDTLLALADFFHQWDEIETQVKASIEGIRGLHETR